MNYKYHYQQISHKGKVRENNEDTCANKKTVNGHLFVLCDGMGGAAEGKKASVIAVKSIIEFFEKESYENLQVALNKSLEFANEQVYVTAQTYPNYKGMGTTACVLLIKDNLIHFAHVGDSRIYLATDENLYQLTNDHSFVNQLLEQGTITLEEAKNHSQKNRILKAIGVRQEVKPSVSSQPIKLKKGDILMLCSDGLSDMVADEVLNDTLAIDASLELKTKNLLNLALENGGIDNISIQTIEIEESPYLESYFIDKESPKIKTVGKIEKSFHNRKLIGIASFIILIAITYFIINLSGFDKNKYKDKLYKKKDTLYTNTKANDSIVIDTIISQHKDSRKKNIKFNSEKTLIDSLSKEFLNKTEKSNQEK